MRRWTDELIQEVRDAVEKLGYDSRHRAYLEVAKRYKTSARAVRYIVNEAKLSSESDSPSPAVEEPLSHRFGTGSSANGEEVVIYKGPALKTLEQLLEATEADLSLFDVSKWEANSYQTPIKTRSGDVEQVTNFQVKATLKARTPRVADLKELASEITDTIKTAKYKAPKKRKTIPAHRDTLLEIGLYDLHIGSRIDFEETGSEWSIEHAAKTAFEAVVDLVEKAEPFNAGTVIYPIGNDFIHVDNKADLSFNGTPLKASDSWTKLVKVGVRIQRTIIDYLAGMFDRVIVPVIPGNHDEQTAFIQGEILAAIYDNDARIEIDNDPQLRKYFSWGNVLLGFTHGRYEPLERLPEAMAVEAKEHWAKSEWREFHMGHFHHRAAKRPMYQERGGVLVRILPTLAALDEHHKRYAWVGAHRGAEAYVYDKNSGPVAALYHTT